jgi:hypothetical protein
MTPWSGKIAVEGVESDDRRLIARDALTWETPLPVGVNRGVEGTQIVGRIDKVWRKTFDDRIEIWGKGIIEGPAESLLDKQVPCGIDVDAITRIEGDEAEPQVLSAGRLRGVQLHIHEDHSLWGCHIERDDA